MTERKETPQDRYLAKYRKAYSLVFISKTEQDMIDWLESQPNKAGYIKNLIREDMAKKKQI